MLSKGSACLLGANLASMADPKNQVPHTSWDPNIKALMYREMFMSVLAAFLRDYFGI